MKILDCTLRDGGYYTNWDFNKDLVDTYFEAFNHLPVDYLEVGYRSIKLPGYLGEYFYLPETVMQRLKASTNKKLVVILNEKDIRPTDVPALLGPCKPYIDMVRMAIDPQNFKRALSLAASVKKMGFEVGFNVMYMSNWKAHKDFLDLIPEVNGIADVFYMVDSYGGVYPNDVKETFDLVRTRTTVPIGFHGHNNLELGLVNTLTAIECGAEMVDATITGMGRGAGNLKTELLLTILNAQQKVAVDFNYLTKVVDPFTEMQRHYDWGTNLAYMVSGAHSLPQKQVMDWVGKRYYSFNSILRALDNQSKGKADNVQLPTIDFSVEKKYLSGIIVGGGNSVVEHAAAIEELLNKNPEMVVIHASSRNAGLFKNLSNDQYFCLVGNEGHRLESVFNNVTEIKGKCILPPFPRKMGTYIPTIMETNAYELRAVDFTEKLKDTHTALAIQTARELGLQSVFLVGYDGYANHAMNPKQHELFKENEYLFSNAIKSGLGLICLTPTTYEVLPQASVYAVGD
jgi:4-hydroxy 2-oxovalerate aldolase